MLQSCSIRLSVLSRYCSSTAEWSVFLAGRSFGHRVIVANVRRHQRQDNPQSLGPPAASSRIRMGDQGRGINGISQPGWLLHFVSIQHWLCSKVQYIKLYCLQFVSFCCMLRSSRLAYIAYMQAGFRSSPRNKLTGAAKNCLFPVRKGGCACFVHALCMHRAQEESGSHFSDFSEMQEAWFLRIRCFSLTFPLKKGTRLCCDVSSSITWVKAKRLRLVGPIPKEIIKMPMDLVAKAMNQTGPEDPGERGRRAASPPTGSELRGEGEGGKGKGGRGRGGGEGEGRRGRGGEERD